MNHQNPYVVEAIDRLSRSLFFYMLIGLAGGVLAAIHRRDLLPMGWIGAVLCVTVYRNMRLHRMAKWNLSEEKAGPMLVRLIYLSGGLSSLFMPLFFNLFDSVMLTVITLANLITVVSAPLIVPSFVFRNRLKGFSLYLLFVVLIMSSAWWGENDPNRLINMTAIFSVCVMTFAKVVMDTHSSNAIDALAIEEAISMENIERNREMAQLQVAQMSHNIRQTVQALNFQLEDAGTHKDALRKQLALMDKFLVRLQQTANIDDDGRGRVSLHVADVEEIVDDAMEIFKVLAQRNGIAISKTGPALYVDLPPEELYFILCNLLSNTIRHSQAHHAYIRWSEVEGVVEIEYRDDGSGFQHSDDQDPIHLHSRRLGIASIEATLVSRGVHFYWDWNARPGMSFRFYVEQRPRALLTQGNLCVVIEDEPMLADMISKLVFDQFDQVIAVERLEEALVQCDELCCLPSLVITDINLNDEQAKKESPASFVRRIRSSLACKVMVLTGDVSVSVENCGADMVLHKPVDGDALREQVASFGYAATM